MLKCYRHCHAIEFRVLNFWLNHLSSICAPFCELFYDVIDFWGKRYESLDGVLEKNTKAQMILSSGISLVSKLELIWYVQLVIMTPVTLVLSLQITWKVICKLITNTKSRNLKVNCQSCWIWSKNYVHSTQSSVDINHKKLHLVFLLAHGIDSLKMTQLTEYELFQLCQLIILPFLFAIIIHLFPSFVIVCLILLAVFAYNKFNLILISKKLVGILNAALFHIRR